MVAEQGKAKTIFLEAVEIVSSTEQQAFIASACGDDDTLLREVEELLGHHQQLGSFLESPPQGIPSLPPRGRGAGGEGSAEEIVAIVDEPISERPGTVIGPYKLLEQIGEGGFGVVFMAEQQHPIRRKVALKVLKLGMDTRQVIARFEAERQALALMDHPNIAKVLDAGTTERRASVLACSEDTSEDACATKIGRPYFVMELVRGLPITDYCDHDSLPVRERLELFLHVCQAVQHAHQKGIIHRDIKPTNVMVTVHDGTPVPKIIDFGIAKALGQPLTDKTLYTGFAQLIGTPMYMSPEQAELSGLDVDTRSDIYSLGVLLYELLTGTTPFDKERLKTVAYDEMRRIIREEEPPKPSTRMSTLSRFRLSSRTSPARQTEPTAGPLTTNLATIAAQRHSDPKRLRQLFRGDLDWIVMKALEKDRNRRYETASTLADDVQRFLHDDPVLACPPSTGYRFRKFARRNKTGLAIAGLSVFFLVVLTTGLAIMSALLWEKQRQTETALKQAETQRQEADRRRQIAEANFARARALVHNKPLKHHLEWVQNRNAEGIEKQSIEKGLAFFQSLLTEPGSDPGERLLTAEVHIELAEIYHSLARRDQATEEYQKAIILLRPMAEEFPNEPGFRDSLAYCYKQLGWLWRVAPQLTSPKDQAEAYKQAISLYTALKEEFPDIPWYEMQLASCWTLLAELERTNGHFQQGEEGHRRALDLYQHLIAEVPQGGERIPFLARSHNHLAWVLAIRPDRTPRNLAEALEHAQKAVDLQPAYHDWWHTLGVAHCRLGHWNKALECIEKSRQLENDPGPPGSFDRFFEAMAYSGLGEKEKARRCYDEGLKWMEKNLPDHADLRRFRAEAAQMLGIAGGP